MSFAPLPQRVHLADRLRAVKESVAEMVTEEFLRCHPDWVARYGERGRRLGTDDASFHIAFLAGAIEAGEEASFRDYVRWALGVLRARGIDAAIFLDTMQRIEGALIQGLPAFDQDQVRRFIRAGCDAAEPSAGIEKVAAEGPLALTERLFRQALIAGERQNAVAIVLEALSVRNPLLDIYIDVLQNALYAVGRMWERNEITVAQEHIATAIAQFALALLFERQPSSPKRYGRVVITGVQGELHQVGANIVADALELDGWTVRFLGSNMPHEGILKVIDEHQANVLGISATMLFNLSAVRDLIADARRQRGGKMIIVVGGSAFRTAPDLYKEIGADGMALDVRNALRVVRECTAS